MKNAVAVVVLLLLAACGSDSSSASKSTTGCSSFAGTSVTADSFASGCTVDAETADQLNLPVGERFVPGTAKRLCEDGRVLIWNDLGWGYEGSTFTMAADGLPPQSETDKCGTEP